MIFVNLTESGEAANRRYLDFVRDMILRIGDGLDEESADTLISTILNLSEYLEANAEA